VVAACPPRTRQSSAFGPSQIGAGATPGYCAFGAFESLSSRASSWSEPEGVHFPGDPYTPPGGMPGYSDRPRSEHPPRRPAPTQIRPGRLLGCPSEPREGVRTCRTPARNRALAPTRA
jgi:hypothetical protein